MPSLTRYHRTIASLTTNITQALTDVDTTVYHGRDLPVVVHGCADEVAIADPHIPDDQPYHKLSPACLDRFQGQLAQQRGH